MKKVIALCSICLSLTAIAKKPVLDIERWHTTQGLQVNYVYLKQLPIVDLRLVFDAGSARNGSKLGLAELTNRMVNQGTNNLSVDQIAEKFSSLGTIYFNESGRDYAMLGFRSLLKHNDESTEIFSELLKGAVFPKSAFTREKQIQLAEIKHSQQNPDKIADRLARKVIYKQHPYASPVLGEQNTVNAIEQEDLKKFYKTYYSNKNGILVIVGALEKEDAQALAEQVSHSLSNEAQVQSLPELQFPQTAAMRHADFPSAQVQLRLVGAGIDRQHPDYFPLQVANYILGGGSLVSRLTHEVREKSGLAYSVYSRFIPMREQGVFWVSLSTRQSQAREALKIVKKVIRQFSESGPTEKELTAAKKNLTGSFPIRLDSNADITQNVLSMAVYNLPVDYLDHYTTEINQVSLDDVQRVLKKYFDVEKLSVITVGKSGELSSS